RAADLAQQIKTNQTAIVSLIRQTKAAPLLDKTGIGPIIAATMLIAWSHPGRVRTEAAFAAIAGVSPLPASSGNTIRHRLNRGGDRRLNHALHMAVITRMAHDPETRAYVAKRQAEGHTTREIRRILKRYLCRQIYRTLNNLHAQPTTAAVNETR
ncbi:MAG: IS110 family transposase, partial [Bifidobacteriaceae bacterium]|nr:IS110 family transposase [Bifidobacteriaceae bacterium]